MGGHRRDDRLPRGGYGEHQFSDQWAGRPMAGDPARRLMRPISWIGVLAGLSVWSLLAWIGYAFVDPILSWFATNAGLLTASGKNLATVAGAGKGVGSVVDNLNVNGFSGQAIALLRVVLKPAIIVLWVIGALALIAAPLVLPRIGRMLGRRRH